MGYDFAVIVVISRLVFSFGSLNQEGQLESGYLEQRSSPTLIEISSDRSIMWVETCHS